MEWFNYYGLIIVTFIMIPNIIYAAKSKNNFQNTYRNKFILTLEQIGRYGAMIFMIINIPILSCGFWFKHSLLIYLIINGLLIFMYIILFFIFWNKNSLSKILALTILPSIIILFSGILLLNIPLIILALVFGVGHITVSIKNLKCT